MADHHHHQQQQQPALPPGFRFHPTDEELILHYLRNRAASAPCPVPIIADVDIYKFDPWDLPAKAAYGDGEYYFFSPRDRKYPNGIRPNRAAGSGYWKATGTDKPIHDAGDSVVVGVKKALVFYRGRPPRGSKTNWIMHEYRLISSNNNANAAAAGCYPRPPSKFRNVSMRLDDWVLCRIYKKSGQASPMVPPLAEYDHLDHDEPSSGGGFDDDVFFCGLTTSASSSSALVMPPHHQQAAEPLMMTTRLPKIPSLSDLFDGYALAQIFDTAAPAPAADHAPLAVHPSLNQLLAVGESDSDLVYCSPAAAPAPGGPVKRSKRAMVTDECAGGGLQHPPPPAKRLSVGSSCFDVAPQKPTAAAASVLGGLSHQYHNNHMLPSSVLGFYWLGVLDMHHGQSNQINPRTDHGSIHTSIDHHTCGGDENN